MIDSDDEDEDGYTEPMQENTVSQQPKDVKGKAAQAAPPKQGYGLFDEDEDMDDDSGSDQTGRCPLLYCSSLSSQLAFCHPHHRRHPCHDGIIQSSLWFIHASLGMSNRIAQHICAHLPKSGLKALSDRFLTQYCVGCFQNCGFAGGVHLDDDAEQDREVHSQTMASGELMLEDDDMPSGLSGSWLLV